MKFFKGLESQIKSEDGIEIEIPDKSNIEMVGKGGYSKVYTVEDVRTNPNGKFEHHTKFALKDYDLFPNISETLKGVVTLTTEAMLKYEYLKNCGVRVFPTCRISEDKTKLLITFANQKGWTLYDTKMFMNENLEKFSGIKNFGEFLNKVDENLKIINRSRIRLAFDVYYFFTRPTDDNFVEIDFVIADLDEIDIDRPEKRDMYFRDDFERHNQVVTKSAIENLLKAHKLRGNLSEDLYKEYMTELNNKFPI